MLANKQGGNDNNIAKETAKKIVSYYNCESATNVRYIEYHLEMAQHINRGTCNQNGKHRCVMEHCD